METNNLSKLGQNIRKQREKLGLSQMKFAELMDMHLNSISMAERGRVNLPALQLIKIAKALNCKITDLFKGIAK